jgi:hypothetical protein
MKFFKRNAIALTALFFAMAGTGIAASQYIITSTSQIKPSVIQQLRGEPLASVAGAKLVAKGGKILRALVHSTGIGAMVTTPPTGRKATRARRARARSAASHGFGRELILAGNSWTQYPEEITESAGDITTTFTQEPNCWQDVKVWFWLENSAGEEVEGGEAQTGTQPGFGTEMTGPFAWEVGGGTAWQYPRKANVVWKVSAEVSATSRDLGTGLACSVTPPTPGVNADLYVLGAQ